MISILTSSDTPIAIVLASDEAVAEANSGEALRAYLASGDASELVVPETATRVLIRALSQSEVHESAQVAEQLHPGAELRAAALYRGGEDALRTDDGIRVAMEFHRYSDARESALIRRAVVGIVGEDLTPEQVAQAFLPGSPVGIYPLSLRSSMRSEICLHIQRLSDLGPLAAPLYRLPSG